MLVHAILFLWVHSVRSRGMNRSRKTWEKTVEEGCALGMCHRPKYFPQPCVSLWHAIRLAYPTVDLCLWHTGEGERDKWVCARMPLMCLFLSLIFDFLHTLSFLSLPLLFSLLPIDSSFFFRSPALLDLSRPSRFLCAYIFLPKWQSPHVVYYIVSHWCDSSMAFGMKLFCQWVACFTFLFICLSDTFKMWIQNCHLSN